MIFGYITLATALIISLSAAVYSILGLTAIFAAAFWPIVILGGSLEFGKIVTTLWLHKYWTRAEIQYKVYLCSAVAVLMFLTSMGVFGFLSKAHTDQGLVSGDVTSKIAIYDDKIKLEKDNIDANRKQLKQMDEAVDQVMARSTTEGGADKAVAIRRSQQKDRSRILAEIGESQKKITTLNEQRAPIAADVRKVEAEVGPIKYIAALVYGDNPDTNVLEKSVRWVIILIVIVFDPLALTLLLAATKSIEWERGIDVFNIKKRDEEDNEEAGRILRQGVTNSDPNANVTITPNKEKLKKLNNWFTGITNSTTQWYDDHISHKKKLNDALGNLDNLEEYNDQELNDIKREMDSIKKSIEEYGDAPIFENKEIELEDIPVLENEEMWSQRVIDEKVDKPDIVPYGNEQQQYAMNIWKISHPSEKFEDYLDMLDRKEISILPWLDPKHLDNLHLSDGDLINLKIGLEADNDPKTGEVRGFGVNFPETASKGDMFLRVDVLPSQLYKYNGVQWIRVNKNLSDNYVYDDAYINHLIEKISSGEYDPELLSDIERERIAEKLKNSTNLG